MKKLFVIFMITASLQGQFEEADYHLDSADHHEENFDMGKTRIGRRASKKTSSVKRAQAAVAAQKQATGKYLLIKDSKLARK